MDTDREQDRLIHLFQAAIRARPIAMRPPTDRHQVMRDRLVRRPFIVLSIAKIQVRRHHQIMDPRQLLKGLRLIRPILRALAPHKDHHLPVGRMGHLDHTVRHHRREGMAMEGHIHHLAIYRTADQCTHDRRWEGVADLL